MVFKEPKIPKHLIIHEEDELRKRSRHTGWRLLVFSALVIGLTIALSGGILSV